MAGDTMEIIDGIPVQAEPEAKAVEDNPPGASWQWVRINPGDTIESLSKQYDRPFQDIVDYNKLNPDHILTGQWIWV